MNLIVNRQLDRSEKQVIFELTLKKRQSKRSTMSERQVAARQQLAQELMQERRDPMDRLIGLSNTNTNNNDSAQSLVLLDEHSLDDQPSNGTCSSSSHAGSNCNSSGCSFTRTDSSYSGSSEGSSTQLTIDQSEILARKKEANIKFNQNRLEHLNGELERRLRQYEYLVAQEKALLDSYNMMMFTNEGVNNFHLYNAMSTPARRVKPFMDQQKKNAHTNSGASSSSSPVPSKQAQRPQLNSSASTVSNLNTLHMLPSFAGPRRSASSVALMTINQSHVNN